MKKYYIGRIKLSKDDSLEWCGNPPFMYVSNTVNRDNINNAILFDNKDVCVKALTNSFKCHKHLPSSKMEIITLSLNVESIEEI